MIFCDLEQVLSLIYRHSILIYFWNSGKRGLPKSPLNRIKNRAMIDFVYLVQNLELYVFQYLIMLGMPKNTQFIYYHRSFVHMYLIRIQDILLD